MRNILILAAALALGGCSQLSAMQGKALVTRDLTPSQQAEFRDLIVNGGHVCGQISVRDGLGLETGYKGFIVDLKTRQVMLEPAFDAETPLTPVEHAFDRLDRGVSILDFSAASLQHCGASVASPAFQAARQTLTRHIGMAAVPRLDDGV